MSTKKVPVKAVTREMVFRTTDGETFDGDGAEAAAEAHQRYLNSLDAARDFAAKYFEGTSEGHRTRVANLIATWEAARSDFIKDEEEAPE